jgi:hypothetical protein
MRGVFSGGFNGIVVPLVAAVGNSSYPRRSEYAINWGRMALKQIPMTQGKVT